MIGHRAPKGRKERGGWGRRHDEYAAPGNGAAGGPRGCCGQIWPV